MFIMEIATDVADVKRRSRFVSGVQQQLSASKIHSGYKGCCTVVYDSAALCRQPRNAVAAAAVMPRAATD